MSPTDPERPSTAPPGRLATLVRTVWGNLVLVLATLILGSIASVVGWLPPRGTWMYRCAQLWSRLLLSSAGVRLTSVFEVPLEPKRGYIFMANHQSMYDIPALIAELPGEVRFMAKKSLFRIPIFGWALTAGGFVPVDRGNRTAAAETYAASFACLSSGRSLLIFPEQTRSKDGKMLPFKKGGAVIALQTGHSIVPVGIRGTHRVRPKKTWGIHPSPVEVHYGRPIEIGDRTVEDREALTAEVRAEVARLAGAPSPSGN
ncbi:MAG: lysophospholipid acyltransferase family protein [Acidobacteriota bacterium]